jgi:hypothetical protein
MQQKPVVKMKKCHLSSTSAKSQGIASKEHVQAINLAAFVLRVGSRCVPSPFLLPWALIAITRGAKSEGKSPTDCPAGQANIVTVNEKD